jgi:hypothetical protein
LLAGPPSSMRVTTESQPRQPFTRSRHAWDTELTRGRVIRSNFKTVQFYVSTLPVPSLSHSPRLIYSYSPVVFNDLGWWDLWSAVGGRELVGGFELEKRRLWSSFWGGVGGGGEEMDITEVSVIHHVGIVLLCLWLLSSFNWCHPVAYFVSLIYLFLVIALSIALLLLIWPLTFFRFENQRGVKKRSWNCYKRKVESQLWYLRLYVSLLCLFSVRRVSCISVMDLVYFFFIFFYFYFGLLIIWELLEGVWNLLLNVHFCLSFWKVHERFVTRLRKKLQFEERKQANQRKVILFLFILFSFLIVIISLKGVII